MAFLQYDYQDQNRNWSGTSTAPAANNDDKEIETDFTTFGLQYMFNSGWGVQAELPFDYRHFTTGRHRHGNTAIATTGTSLATSGIEGIYTEFFADLSAGVTFGVKLPTGELHG